MGVSFVLFSIFSAREDNNQKGLKLIWLKLGKLLTGHPHETKAAGGLITSNSMLGGVQQNRNWRATEFYFFSDFAYN